MDDLDDSDLSISPSAGIRSVKASWQDDGPGLGGPRPIDQGPPDVNYLSKVEEDPAGGAGDGLAPAAELGGPIDTGSQPPEAAPETVTAQYVEVTGGTTVTSTANFVIVP